MNSDSESLIALKDLPAFLQERNGRRPSIATIYRWTSRGLNGCQLEVVYRAGRPYTSVEALKRFDDAVTLAKRGPAPRTNASSSAPALNAHDRAKRRLAKDHRKSKP